MSTTTETLAANLRRLRIARHLSLSELARATQISKATLSGIENETANPTVGTLDALAGALRVSLAELLAELPPPAVRVLRASGAPALSDGPRMLERFGAASGEQLLFSELAVPAGRRTEYPPRRPGERIGLYVIEGMLIAGPEERPTELGAGDYITFPADTPYVIETGRRAGRVLLAELSA